ncbi:MAG: alpha/beta hydrolase [Pirellulaceae bacterium]
MRALFCFAFAALVSFASLFADAQETTPNAKATQFVWPDLAPGETSRSVGETLPMRPQDNPPITRVEKIRRPTITVFPATENANGAAVVILPGGGFGRVVPDLEGSEAAAWLNKLGATCFVVNYRTNEVTPKDEPAWKRSLQDSQRVIRWVRANADQWKLNTDKVGLLAFSAGGQVGSMLITTDQAAYEPIDKTDSQSFRPDFAMLVYPWNCYDVKTDALLPQIKVSPQTPPTFIVHTHDDNSSSLGAIYLYADLKKNNVPAELHVYENGGHGYGTRDRDNSNIGSWTERATDWLGRKL